MSSKVPQVAFNNGQVCPIIGLGTWRSEPGIVAVAVEEAINLGYRHFDCAFFYGNEKEIGEGIAKAISSGKVERKDLFVTSKLWNTFHRRDLVKPALRESLSNLGLEYLDLYLMHWPTGFKEGDSLMPVDDQGKTLFSETDFTETWEAMEQCVQDGLVKSIGLSNFNEAQTQKILSSCQIKPVNNQIESHPYLAQRDLIKFCQSNGITVTAYRPLGSPGKPKKNPDEIDMIDEPIIKQLAAKYGKTPAQILVKYQVDRGVIVIPKSVNKERMKSNIEVFDFTLTQEDISLLDSLDRGFRFSPLDIAIGHKDYPF